MHKKHKACKDYKRKTDNKGVTARARDLELDEPESSQTVSNVPIVDGIQNVKDAVQNAIELMGPSTANLSQNLNSEPETERSMLSSSYGPEFEVKSDSKPSSSDTPRDISLMSGLPFERTFVCSDSVGCDNAKDELYGVTNFENHYVPCPYAQHPTKLQKPDEDNADVLRYNFDYNLMNGHNQRVHGINELNTQPVDENKRCSKEKVMNFFNFLKMKRNGKESTKEPLDLYRINIMQTNDCNSPPKRVVFDLIEDMPKPDTINVATNTSKLKDRIKYGIHGHTIETPFHSMVVNHKVSEKTGITKKETLYRKLPSSDNPTRVDVYYFDHGNASYFRTTDSPPLLMTELLAEKTESYTTKFWAQFFGTVHIGFSFLTSFVLQLIRFILQSLIRPLTVGVAQLGSDYFFKPCLAVLFNAVIQPPLIFLYNVATSLRDLCDPLAEGVGYFLREIANVCGAIRLVDAKCGNQCQGSPRGKNKINKERAKAICKVEDPS